MPTSSPPLLAAGAGASVQHRASQDCCVAADPRSRHPDEGGGPAVLQVGGARGLLWSVAVGLREFVCGGGHIHRSGEGKVLLVVAGGSGDRALRVV